MVKLDWMHCADMGVLSYELGELWWSILPELGANRLAGLEVLKVRIAAYYAATKPASRIPIGRLTLRKVKANLHPKLKAKAAQTRDLLAFSVNIAEEMRHVNPSIGEDRYQSILCLSEIYVLAKHASLADDDLAHWRWLAAVHMYYYARCGFRVYPKHHYFMHLPEHMMQSGMPRSFWVYAEESKNAQLKRLFNVSSKGHSVCQQILLRLEWLFAIQHLLRS